MKKTNRSLLITALLICALSAVVLLPHTASAARAFPSIVPQCDQGISSSTFKTINSCDFNDFIQLFINLFDWGLAILSILSVTFFLIGGGILLVSGGNQNRVSTGKSILANTLIGVLIALASWLIVNTVIGLLVGNGALKNVQVFGRFWWGMSTCSEKYSKVCDKNNLRLGCGDVKTTHVSELQKKLQEFGDCGSVKVDGCFGPQTRDAVIAYNRAQKGAPLSEEAAEYVDKITWDALDAGKSCTIQVSPTTKPGGGTGCCVPRCASTPFEQTAQFGPDGCLTIFPNGGAVWYDTLPGGACDEEAYRVGCCALESGCIEAANMNWCRRQSPTPSSFAVPTAMTCSNFGMSRCVGGTAQTCTSL